MPASAEKRVDEFYANLAKTQKESAASILLDHIIQDDLDLSSDLSLFKALRETEGFDEEDLLRAFYKLDDNERLYVLYKGMIKNSFNIAVNREKIKVFEHTEKMGIKSLILKVAVISFVFIGVIAFLAFMFMILKNETVGQSTLLSSFFKTVYEIINVIFISE
jgi:hypothetical protein